MDLEGRAEGKGRSAPAPMLPPDLYGRVVLGCGVRPQCSLSVVRIVKNETRWPFPLLSRSIWSEGMEGKADAERTGPMTERRNEERTKTGTSVARRLLRLAFLLFLIVHACVKNRFSPLTDHPTITNYKIVACPARSNLLQTLCVQTTTASRCPQTHRRALSIP